MLKIFEHYDLDGRKLTLFHAGFLMADRRGVQLTEEVAHELAEALEDWADRERLGKLRRLLRSAK